MTDTKARASIERYLQGSALDLKQKFHFEPCNPTLYKPKWFEELKLKGRDAPVYIIDETEFCRRNDVLDSVVYGFMNTIGYFRKEKIMKEYEIEFEKRIEEAREEYAASVAAAKEKKDLTIREAERVRDAAKMKEEKEERAAELRAEYDAYISQGFTAKQAEAFVMKKFDAPVAPAITYSCQA